MRHLKVLKKAAIAFCGLMLVGGVTGIFVGAAMYMTGNNSIASIAIVLAIVMTALAYIEEFGGN